MDEILANEEALAAAAALAGKGDDWMTPNNDMLGEDERKEFASFKEAEHDRWEETAHFEIYYGRKLLLLADAEAARTGTAVGSELYHEDILEPLKSAFWEAWDNAHTLLAYWEKKVRTPPIFSCDRCGEHELTCVQTGMTVTSSITVEDEMGEGNLTVVYDTPDLSDGDTTEFSCRNCGLAIPGISDDDDLIEWLAKRGAAPPPAGA